MPRTSSMPVNAVVSVARPSNAASTSGRSASILPCTVGHEWGQGQGGDRR
jgi:hypothetical protein